MTFTVTEGAEVCKVSEETIRRWIKRGWLSAKKDGRAWSFTAPALMHAEHLARLARQRRLT